MYNYVYICVYSSLSEFLLAKYERPPGDLCVRFGGRIRVGLRGRAGQTRARPGEPADRCIPNRSWRCGFPPFCILFAEFIDGIRFNKKTLISPEGLTRCEGSHCVYFRLREILPPSKPSPVLE